MPFLVVGTQQTIPTLALCNEGQFPTQIECVLNSGIHALAAHRAVHMCGISSQKDTAHPHAWRHAGVHGKRADPCRVVQVHGHAKSFQTNVLDFFQGQILRIQRHIVGSVDNDSPTVTVHAGNECQP